jgi:hypothetical protein
MRRMACNTHPLVGERDFMVLVIDERVKMVLVSSRFHSCRLRQEDDLLTPWLLKIWVR